jgi:aflatoxin B1 aldehyde reductase
LDRPLAGGFLTGKITFRDPNVDLSQGRWAEGKFPGYPATFDKPGVHAALKKFYQVCEQHGLTSTEASLRWIMYHSKLGDEDAIILGATRIDQLEGNVVACKRGPLPREVLKAAEEMWESLDTDFKDLDF